jgi:hypothetical protein
MALGDPATPEGQVRLWSDQRPTALPSSKESDQDPEEQWLFQFHEHMLLTVQAIHRLHQAISERMLGPIR